MTYNMYVYMHVYNMYSVYKVDYRGAAAPQNVFMKKKSFTLTS